MKKENTLKKYFGYDTFRPGQEILINGILDGRDTFGVMPTGAGKSLCYQIPALLLPGITLVISPLISLMKDQVTTLNQAGIHAAYLNSSLTPGQYQTAVRNMVRGQYKIVYVAPERLLTQNFLEAVRKISISMVSVDEAHCISQWGQDFRPDYLKIREFVEQLGYRPVISAFTATATKEVREDILALLDLQNPVCLTTGFDRPNLRFIVKHPADKKRAVLEYLEEHEEDCGIIYCLTRKTVEEVCGELNKKGYSATRYHAGLSDEERKRNQEDFIFDRKQIMVATNAFGMGIDKSNVHYELHYNMPKNMESYYQEAGRAGRDGLPSECILFYAGQDVVTNQFFIDRISPQEESADEFPQDTTEMIKERERERLKKMTFYCFTNECLREYILRYFGEYGSGYCGNCSNCLTQFEEKDVSQTAANLIGCVKTARRSYGMTLIVDTVHGSRSSRIQQTGLEQNPYYGSCEAEPVYKIRQVLNHLLVQGYLIQTDAQYPVLEIGDRAQEILDGRPVLMKAAKEQPKKADGKKNGKGKASSSGGGEIDRGLFEKLRQLRLEIARKEKVPPYIIFSDKTLVQMCQIRPGTKQEMLTVSGVGEVKYSRYGEAFLEVLQGENVSVINDTPEDMKNYETP